MLRKYTAAGQGGASGVVHVFEHNKSPAHRSLAPAGVPLAYTIVVIDSQVVLAAALALCIGALRTRRARRRIRAASPAPQAAVPYAALRGARWVRSTTRRSAAPTRSRPATSATSWSAGGSWP